MKKIMLFAILLPVTSFSQTENIIEGLKIDAPCLLQYTRNLGNQNNYSCTFQDNEEKVYQYSVTTQNLFVEMNGLSLESLQVFKEQFLKTSKENAESNGESVKQIVLKNGEKGLMIESYLTYSNQKFINKSIIFFYKQKSFVFNITTNNLNASALKNLIDTLDLK